MSANTLPHHRQHSKSSSSLGRVRDTREGQRRIQAELDRFRIGGTEQRSTRESVPRPAPSPPDANSAPRSAAFHVSGGILDGVFTPAETFVFASAEEDYHAVQAYLAALVAPCATCEGS